MTPAQELKFFLDHTFNEMTYLKQTGRVSDRLFGHYIFLWTWGTFHYSDAHDRFYRRFGADRYWRRIDRVKALIERIRQLPTPPPEQIPFALGTLNR
jgi:hypothetical protein